MTTERHGPEWLIENADHGIAFEVACASALTRLLAANAELQQQLEAIGAGGVGPLMKTSSQNHVEQRLGMVALSRAVVEQAMTSLNLGIAMYPNGGTARQIIQASINALSAALEQRQDHPEQEPDAFCEWRSMRPSLTRLQAWLLWKDQAKAEGGAA